jgi:hypothetical protein|tara:strand:+ start:3787 stop:3894 length:108 start_codon:yes stop_codon:yes gene_type:complete
MTADFWLPEVGAEVSELASNGLLYRHPNIQLATFS